MMKLSILVILTILSCTFSRIHEIELKRKYSRQTIQERHFFFLKFKQYPNLVDFIRSNASKVKFFLKNFKKIRQFYREYEMMNSQKYQLGSENLNISYVYGGSGEYFGEIGVGTPLQNITIQIDTGSSYIWVPSILCTTCFGNQRFNQFNSKTYKFINNSFQAAYGGGLVANGNQMQDNLYFGGLTAENFIMNLALNETEPQIPFFGLAFPSGFADTNGSPGLIQTLKNTNVIEKAVFSLYLTQDDLEGSKLIIGGTNQNYYKGTFTYLNVTSKPLWLVDFEGFVVNGKTYNDSNYNQGFFDTGTYFIASPSQNLANNIINAVGTYSCNDFSSAPIVSLVFQGNSFPLTPKDYFLPVDLDNTLGCSFGILNFPYPYYIIGTTFINSYYLAFDYDQETVGIAQLK